MIRVLALFSVLFFPAASIADTAAADPRPVLIELFASQNCAACPKAHRVLREVSSERDDVFVLTWSVDYWDYLGSPDPMAIPNASERQRIYVDNLELRAPYTPQSVYNGVKECPAPKRDRVIKNIERLSTDQTARSESIKSENGTLTVFASAEDALDIIVIDYLSETDNPTDMLNPVTAVRKVGEWPDALPTEPITCSGSCVALLQKPGQGAVMALTEISSG